MKIPSLKALAKAGKERRGIALISVLTMMSLTTILVLTFFSLAQNEYESSSTYSDGLQAQQIAEEAVNMVIRQIREATADPKLAWASQPGAIRTWDDQGRFNSGYKLYSDDDMVGSWSEQSLVEEDYKEFQNWDKTPWRFVDLNEPVIRGEKVYYPIVDPNAADIPAWPKAMGGVSGSDDRGIEGFAYTLSGTNTRRGDRFDARGIGGVCAGAHAGCRQWSETARWSAAAGNPADAGNVGLPTQGRLAGHRGRIGELSGAGHSLAGQSHGGPVCLLGG